MVRFSIFIPVWNEADWLPDAIESVLGQTHGDWELVIGDNASTDDLAAVVARYPDPRIRYHRWTKHVGLSENFNRTSTLCRYDWVQALCADDRLYPRCLERLAASITAPPPAAQGAASTGTEVAMVLAACRRVDTRGRLAEHEYYGYLGVARVLPGRYDAGAWLRCMVQPGVTPWNIGAVAISRDVLAEMGGYYRPEIGEHADMELATRVAAYGDVVYLDEPGLEYTVRPLSASYFESRLARERGGPPSLVAAYRSALRAHELRRHVPAAEREAVQSAIARVFLRRAVQHRYLAGGRGRRAAVWNVVQALLARRRTTLAPWQLTIALGALLAPSATIAWAREALLARRQGIVSEPLGASRDWQ